MRREELPYPSRAPGSTLTVTVGAGVANGNGGVTTITGGGTSFSPLLAVWLEPLAAASLPRRWRRWRDGRRTSLLEAAVPEALAAVAEHIARSSCYQVWAAAAAELPLEPPAADHLKEHSCLVVPVLATEPEAVAAHHCSATAEDGRHGHQRWINTNSWVWWWRWRERDKQCHNGRRSKWLRADPLLIGLFQREQP